MSGILIGIDSSEASGRALAFGLALASAQKVPALIVHAIPWSPYSFTTHEENEHRAAVRDKELAAAQVQLLEPAIAKATSEGLTAEGVVRHAHPVDLLIEIAELHAASQIVVGRTGESKIKVMITGGVPGRLVVGAPVPVTVVP